MPDQDEFTDSTDWLPTPLKALAPLDSSLRCQVCKNFFTTPMMTSCSHTFCSLCIRRYLSQEGRCPACREPDQEIKLRRNWAVEELVATFTASRKGLLGFATAAAKKAEEGDEIVEQQRPRKRPKVKPESTSNGIERRSTRSQSKKTASDAASQQSARATQETIEDSEDEGSIYDDEENKQSPHFINGNTSAQPHDRLVECPCCHRRMKEALINAHLDRCIQGDSHTPFEDRVASSSPAPIYSGQIAPPGTIAYSQKKPSKHNQRLPYINYSLFTDTKLRQKLRESGIPNTGSKDLMRRRHTEWVNLWNANCDSTTPVTRRELLRELKIWEDTLGRQLERPITNTGFMAKEFDRDRHIQNQRGNFDELIRQARERAKVKAQSSEEKHTRSADESPVPEAVAGLVAEPAMVAEPARLVTLPETETETETVVRQHVTGLENPLRLIPNANEQQQDLRVTKGLPNGHSSDAAIEVQSSPLLPESATQVVSMTNQGTPSKRFFI